MMLRTLTRWTPDEGAKLNDQVVKLNLKESWISAMKEGTFITLYTGIQRRDLTLV